MDTEIALDPEDAPHAARSLRMGKPALLLVAVACFAAVAAIGYAIIAMVPLPGYAAWTGVRPLENKLAQLQAFCAQGDVDALAFGSSIVDFGFSAETFSSLMSRRLVRPYRVFNFATGGAEPRTLPKLYRFARTACKPKAVFVIAPAEQRLRDELAKGSPDHALEAAPVGPVLRNQRLLDLDKKLWSLPILKRAPAARDMLLFGGYRNMPSGMDSYEVNAHGDRKSYLMTWKVADLPAQKKVNEIYVSPLPAVPATPDAQRAALDHFFAKPDSDAMHELARLATEDGASIVLFTHAAAATYFQGVGDNAAYNEGRREFYRAFASALGARLVDVDERMNVPSYAISDTTHLNTFGARMYTRAAFGAFVGAPPDDPDASADAVAMQPPPKGLFPTTDHSFNAYAALIRRPAGEADPLLRFRMVDSSDVPPLPDGPLYAVLRTPEGKDIVAPAAPIGSHEFVAEVGLPASAQPEGLVLRLCYDESSPSSEGTEKVAAMNPLADYEWVKSFPARPIAAAGGAVPPIVAWPPVRRPGDRLYVGVRGDVKMPAEVAVSLEPRQGAGPVELGRAHLEADKLASLAVPATAAPGEYALRLRDAATGAPLAATASVEVTMAGVPHYTKVAVVEKPTLGKGTVKVRWSGIVKPRKHDWVGLFPVGSGPGGRLDIVFTDAKPEGEMEFPIAPSILPQLTEGELEFRLYASGGWQMLARSEPFRFETPAGMKPVMAAAPPIADPAPGASGTRVFSERDAPLNRRTVPVGWAGIAAPTDQDWVGLFPVGGPPESRLEFVFTKGQAEGHLDFPLNGVPHSRLASGQYEFRIYAAGGWTMLARSEPIRFSSGK